MKNNDLVKKFMQEVQQSNLALGAKAREIIKQLADSNKTGVRLLKVKSYTEYEYNDSYDEERIYVDFICQIDKDKFEVTQTYQNSFGDNIDNDIFDKHAQVLNHFSEIADSIYAIVTEMKIEGVLYESK